jgi:hypothetical protein
MGGGCARERDGSARRYLAVEGRAGLGSKGNDSRK